MKFLVIALSMIVCGFVGASVLAIALVGTNVLLPGLGLVVSGSLIGFVAGAFFGALAGLLIGFFVSRILFK